MIKPENTYALLVGVEKYDAGKDWNLDGPANDVYNFVNWLISNNVPNENISIFLSPLDENIGIANKLATITNQNPQYATKRELETAITNLKNKNASLFILFWAGHGCITIEGERRLYYADATNNNLKNLNFNAQMTAMRTDLYIKIPKQIFLVDACANYITGKAATLPNDTPAQGKPLSSHEQFALFAAKSGDYAKNTGKQGLFSRELLIELENIQIGESFPLEMEILTARLQQRFITLRKQKQTDQTPSYYLYQDWGGNERMFSQIDPITLVSKNMVSFNRPIALPRKLKVSELSTLRDLFLRCNCISKPEIRVILILQLRNEIANNIRWSSDNNSSFLNLIDTCRNYEGGLQELLDTMEFFEENSISIKALRQTINNMLPDQI